MLCKECRDKPIVRGLKTIECKFCGCQTFVNYAYQDICEDCSDDKMICQCCGKEIKKEFSHYHISWLESAVGNFKKQNMKVHMVKNDMTIGEFIEKWTEIDKIVKL
jgi:hypothetical protein